jgi:hypothetical protein
MRVAYLIQAPPPRRVCAPGPLFLEGTYSHSTPVSAAPHVSPAPTAVQATGPCGAGRCAAHAAGSDAEASFPSLELVITADDLAAA